MKTHLQAIKIILCALTLGVCGVAQATVSGMVDIPPVGTTNGPFLRGDANDGNADGDAPTKWVNVSAFQMDSNLVTYTLWTNVYKWATTYGGYSFSNAGSAFSANKANQPVHTVDWFDAVKWCNARTEMENALLGSNLKPCYYTDTSLQIVYRNGELSLLTNKVDWAANGYRLPTEAEWEKAARGGLTGFRFPRNNLISHSEATYQSPAVPVFYDAGPYNTFPVSTTPAGQLAANGYGLHDMAGNVFEWCWDFYSSTYYTNSISTNNPIGPATSLYRVARGGSWNSLANGLRTAKRAPIGAATAANTIGFRSVRNNAQQPQTISFNSSNNQTNLTYGGGSITLTATASSGSNVTFTVTSGQAAATVTNNSLTITGVGQVTVTASVDASASYSAASTNLIFMISKATPSVTVNVGTYTYTGSAQGPNSVTTPSSGSATYSYVGVSGTAYGPSATKPTGAGSYTVMATVAADANYNSASSSATAFTIAKAASTVTVTGTTSFTYSGSAQGPNTSTGTGSSGAVTYSYVGVSGTTYGPSATKPTGAGSYTVTATVAADGNYNSASSSATAFSIAKATPTVTVTGTTSFIYSGSAQGPNSVTTSPVSTGSVTYSYVGVSGTTYGPSATKPTGAGSYTVTAAVVADANNNSASSSATAFTIAKAASTVTVTGTTNFTYTGSAQGPDTANVTGSTGTVSYSYSGTNNSGASYGPSATPPTAAGSYTVTATVAADANYSSASSSPPFSIGRAPSGVTVTGTINFTYTGSAQGPNTSTVTGSTGAKTYSYSGTVNSGASYGPSATPPTAAGSYTVTATVAADANYNSASSSATAFTIGIVDQGELNAVLARYWANSPPYIANFDISAKTNFTFIITNFNFFTVQFSTNLVNTNWQDLGQVVYQFTDTNAAIRQTGFYRLIASTNALVPDDTNGDGIVDQGELNAVLANYWANSPPYIANFDISAKTNFTFIITNFNFFTVQFSTNLVNTNWQGLGQAKFQFTDTNAAIRRMGFYRIVASTNSF